MCSTAFIPKLFVRLLWFFRRTAALFCQIRTFPQLFRFCSEVYVFYCMVSYDNSHTLHICAAQHVLPHCAGVCRQSERHMYSTAWNHMYPLSPYTPVRRSACDHTAQVCVESQKGICILLRETVWILSHPANLCCAARTVAPHRCVQSVRKTNLFYCVQPYVSKPYVSKPYVSKPYVSKPYVSKPYVSSDTLHTHAAQHVLPHCAGVRKVSERRTYFTA